MKKLSILLAFCLMFMLCATACAQAQETTPAPQSGKPHSEKISEVSVAPSEAVPSSQAPASVAEVPLTANQQLVVGMLQSATSIEFQGISLPVTQEFVDGFLQVAQLNTWQEASEEEIIEALNGAMEIIATFTVQNPQSPSWDTMHLGPLVGPFVWLTVDGNRINFRIPDEPLGAIEDYLIAQLNLSVSAGNEALQADLGTMEALVLNPETVSAYRIGAAESIALSIEQRQELQSLLDTTNWSYYKNSTVDYTTIPHDMALTGTYDVNTDIYIDLGLQQVEGDFIIGVYRFAPIATRICRFSVSEEQYQSLLAFQNSVIGTA